MENFQNEPPIIQALFDLYYKLYLKSQRLPKQVKYTLGQKSENLLLDILDLAVLAYRKPKIEQLPLLERVDAKMEVLRLNIRLIWQLGLYKNKEMIDLQKKLSEIGKMLGGWIKSRKII